MTTEHEYDYDPSDTARVEDPWSTAFLSQRDLSLQVPINYVTAPGVSLTAACFAHNQYEDRAASLCLSNLLAAGFRRLVIDLYWDAGRAVWSLCPAQLPFLHAGDDIQASATLVSFTSTNSFQSATFSDGAPNRSAPPLLPMPTQSAGSSPFQARQASTTSTIIRSISTEDTNLSSVSSSSIAGNLTNGTTTSSSVTPLATLVSPNGQPLIEVGPYNCTPTVGLPLLTGILRDYFDDTDTTLQATIHYLVFNIHAAVSQSSPLEPAEAPDADALPDSNSLLGMFLDANLSAWLYTPESLQQGRANINSTWYTGLRSTRPDSVYYSTAMRQANMATSSDGWPGAGYLVFGRYLRALAGFGRVDPQMAQYNFTGDSRILFPPGYIQDLRGTTFGAAGQLTSGCIFDSDASTVSAVNSSWAVSSNIRVPELDSGAYNATIASVSNLTSCGISPLLNQTLLNTTAWENITFYKSIAYSSIWSWATGEPHNITDDEDPEGRNRCALMHVNDNGRWRVTRCSERHRAACRVNNQPYVWRISSDEASYSSSGNSCPENSSFAVPRTALESMYLLDATRQVIEDRNATIWVNFNALDEVGCWVTGINSTCPYVNDEEADRTRAVVVPTVAAVIVFVLAALTVFGRRRKGDDGWDYEGVPS
ncbi:Maintenance of telomere capping protein 6 [Coniosporium tulheliwenetii]|uniref:Maintenance of telomere capping protein 6 n=1 Tax=Coniosporium tulheliwenetii TaxID=3383036 RepID=A0ACC2YN38_9PEZI|nr:Maintenance of telomere capping protein 6 [Cladosporium sp. JES 115]